MILEFRIVHLQISEYGFCLVWYAIFLWTWNIYIFFVMTGDSYVKKNSWFLGNVVMK